MFSQDYRPKAFDEFIGQGGTISEMKSRSVDLNFPQVMIFEGASGTGKTSLAYLIAALLNDPNPIQREENGIVYIDPNPDSPAFHDIYSEIFSRGDVKFYDASSMSKGDVHEVERFISMNPMFDPHRVAIIDEAQELSRAGKGATLRLLEKKRKSAYIILCTMNAQSLDEAVLSRGTRYTFSMIPPLKLAEGLYKALQRSEADVPDIFISEGLFTLAENVNGSVRTGLQYLERCIEGKFFTPEAIQEEFGFLSSETMLVILKELLRDGSAKALFETKLDPQHFLFTALTYMGEAAHYVVTGESTVDWKKKVTLEIKDLPHFREFYGILTELLMMPYFHRGVFYQRIWEFTQDNQKVVTRNPVSLVN